MSFDFIMTTTSGGSSKIFNTDLLVNFEDDVIFYPNPTDNMLIISLKSINSHILNVNIYNGHDVLVKTSNNNKVSLSCLKTNVYILLLKTNTTIFKNMIRIK